jgi:iron complex outermembrane recepter protein
MTLAPTRPGCRRLSFQQVCFPICTIKNATIAKCHRNVVFTLCMSRLFNSMKLSHTGLHSRRRVTAATTRLQRGGGVFMRATVAVAVACLSLVGITSGKDADAAIRRPTNIAPQGLAPALKMLAEERNVQVVYRSELVSDQKTGGAAGVLTFEEALTQLLNGTGLTFRYLDDKAITIVPRVTGSSPSAQDSSAIALAPAAPGSTGKLRLAQGEQVKAAAAMTAEEQGGGSSPLKLEEVLVTAQKRPERLIDVPISIVAVTAEEIEKRKVTSLDDLSLVAPGLSIKSNGSYTRSIAIRGVNNSVGGSNLIGVYLDEMPASSVTPGFQLDLRTYDLERVEVLRGPQGTLYGEGSVGGTVRFITRNPNLDHFGVRSEVAGLFTQDGEVGQRIEGALNMPLIQNELGLRLAGTYSHAGGWIDQPAASKNDYNAENLKDVRIKGLWQPNPRFAVNLMALAHRNDQPPANAEDANGNFTQVFRLTTTPNVEDNFDLYNLTLSYDFASARLLSATGYVDQQKTIRHYGTPRQFTPPPTPQTNLLLDLNIATGKSFTEELRLVSLDSGHWQWTAGAFYRDARARQRTPAAYFGVPGPPGTPLPPALTLPPSGNESKSWAAFGDMSYRLTNRLTVGTGLRYFDDEQEDLPTGRVAKFHALNPRVYGQFKFMEQLNGYASVAKGFRSGGFNGVNQPDYEPESAWTYELGTKMLLADGRVSSDAAVFYTDYSDYQITGIVALLSSGVPSGGTNNAGKVKIKGVEWALTLRSTDQWMFSLNSAYLDAEIKTTSTSFAAGDPVDGVPKYQFTASGQRDFTWHGRQGFARLDYNQQDRMTYRNRSFGPWYFSESDIINMLNFNLSLQWSDSLSLGLFAQNLLNDRGYTNGNTIEALAARARPRTCGISFGVSFD